MSRTVEAIRAADPRRPVGADVWDGFQPYSSFLDLVGAHRWPLFTSLELDRYRDWLDQRGRLPLCERCHAEAPHDHVFGRPR